VLPLLAQSTNDGVGYGVGYYKWIRPSTAGTMRLCNQLGLGVPVENRWGLRPARDPETRGIAPPAAMRDLDFHPHLPHYALTTDDAKLIRVLARQPIDMSHPHPFTEAGNREFNTFLWMPPSGARAGDIVLVDLTIFTTLFGGTESLDRFWSNLATRI
jgi:hypothetical protein